MSEPRQSAERRRHYRTAVSASLGIDARVVASDGHKHVGELLDLSVGGAGVRVPRTPTPPIHAGEGVALELHAPGLPAPVVVRASVQRCVPMAHGYLYGLRFIEALELRASASSRLREAFNRRRLVRVRPNPPGSIRVVVTPDGHMSGAVVLGVVDLSASGLGVTAAAQAHQLLGRHYDFAVSITLPGVADELRLVAHVRYRVRERSGWHYGLEFDQRRSAGFAATQRRLAEYIREHLREQSSRSGRG